MQSRRGQTGRGDGFAGGFLGGQVEVEREEEGEGVFAVLHAVGGADGGVEGGVGVAEAVGAGGFEGAVEVAQGPAVGGHDLAAQGAQGDGGFGHRFDLGERRRLRPGEGVEDGVGGVAEVAFEGGAARLEPGPVDAGLEDAEGVVVSEREDDERVVRVDGRRR